GERDAAAHVLGDEGVLRQRAHGFDRVVAHGAQHVQPHDGEEVGPGGLLVGRVQHLDERRGVEGAQVGRGRRDGRLAGAGGEGDEEAGRHFDLVQAVAGLHGGADVGAAGVDDADGQRVRACGHALDDVLDDADAAAAQHVGLGLGAGAGADEQALGVELQAVAGEVEEGDGVRRAGLDAGGEAFDGLAGLGGVDVQCVGDAEAALFERGAQVVHVLRAGVDGGGACVGVGAGQRGRACGLLHQIAAASDDGGDGEGVAAVQYERAVVGDGAGAQRAGRAAVADIDGAARRDGGGAAVGVGAGQREGVGALLVQRAGAADGVGHRDGVAAVDGSVPLLVTGARTQRAGGAAVADTERAACGDGGGAAVGVGAGQPRRCRRWHWPRDGVAAVDDQRAVVGDRRPSPACRWCRRCRRQRAAGSDGGGAAVGVGAGQREGVAALLVQRTGAADGVGDGDGVAAVDDQRAVVGDGARAQRAGGAAIADAERAGIDGGGAAVGVGAGQRGRAGGLLHQVAVPAMTAATRAGAADGVGHRDGVAAVDDQRAVVGDGARTQRAGGAAVADAQRAAGGDGGGAAVGVGTRQREGVGALLVQRAGAADGIGDGDGVAAVDASVPLFVTAPVPSVPVVPPLPTLRVPPAATIAADVAADGEGIAAVEGQRAGAGDGAGAHGAGGAAIADAERAGIDGGGAAVGVGAGQRGRAGALLHQVAAAGDDGGDGAAGGDGGGAAVGVGTRQREGVGALLVQRAGAADGIGDGDGVAAVDASVPLFVTAPVPSVPVGAAVADRQRAARGDGGGAAVAHRAADGIGDGDGVAAVDDQRAVVGDGARAQRAGGAAVADAERAGVDGGGAAVGVGAGQRDGAGGRLHEAHGAREDGADVARLHVEVRGAGEHTAGGAGDAAALQRHPRHGIGARVDVERAAVDDHLGRTRQDIVGRQGRRACDDVDRRDRQRAVQRRVAVERERVGQQAGGAADGVGRRGAVVGDQQGARCACAQVGSAVDGHRTGAVGVAAGRVGGQREAGGRQRRVVDRDVAASLQAQFPGPADGDTVVDDDVVVGLQPHVLRIQQRLERTGIHRAIRSRVAEVDVGGDGAGTGRDGDVIRVQQQLAQLPVCGAEVRGAVEAQAVPTRHLRLPAVATQAAAARTQAAQEYGVQLRPQHHLAAIASGAGIGLQPRAGAHDEHLGVRDVRAGAVEIATHADAPAAGASGRVQLRARARAHDAFEVQHRVGKAGARDGAQLRALRGVDLAELVQPRFQVVVVAGVEQHEAVALDVDRHVAGRGEADAGGVDAAAGRQLRCDEDDGVRGADAAFGAQFTGAFGRGAQAQPAALQVGVADAQRRGDEAADIDLRARREVHAARVAEHDAAVGVDLAEDARGVVADDAVDQQRLRVGLDDADGFALVDREAAPVDGGRLGGLVDLHLTRLRRLDRDVALLDDAALRQRAGGDGRQRRGDGPAERMDAQMPVARSRAAVRRHVDLPDRYAGRPRPPAGNVRLLDEVGELGVGAGAAALGVALGRAIGAAGHAQAQRELAGAHPGGRHAGAAQRRRVHEGVVLLELRGRVLAVLDVADVVEEADDGFAADAPEQGLGRQEAQLEAADDAAVAGALAGGERAHAVRAAEAELLGGVQVLQAHLATHGDVGEQAVGEDVLQPREAAGHLAEVGRVLAGLLHVELEAAGDARELVGVDAAAEQAVAEVAVAAQRQRVGTLLDRQRRGALVAELLVLHRQQREEVQVARTDDGVQAEAGDRHGVAGEVEREFVLVQLVAHRRDGRAELQAAAADGRRVVDEAEEEAARRRREYVARQAVTAAEGAVHRGQAGQPEAAEEARAVGVEVGAGRPGGVGARRDDQAGRAGLAAGLHLDLGGDAAQVVDEEDDALDVAHLEDAAGLQLVEISLHDLALHRQPFGPVQPHFIQPALEHGDAHDATDRLLLGDVGIAQVVAQLALQEARHLRGGVGQVLEAARLANEGCRQPGQRGPQFGGGVVRNAEGLDVDAQVVGRLAELARGGRAGHIDVAAGLRFGGQFLGCRDAAGRRRGLRRRLGGGHAEHRPQPDREQSPPDPLNPLHYSNPCVVVGREAIRTACHEPSADPLNPDAISNVGECLGFARMSHPFDSAPPRHSRRGRGLPLIAEAEPVDVHATRAPVAVVEAKEGVLRPLEGAGAPVVDEIELVAERVPGLVAQPRQPAACAHEVHLGAQHHGIAGHRGARTGQDGWRLLVAVVDEVDRHVGVGRRAGGDVAERDGEARAHDRRAGRAAGLAQREAGQAHAVGRARAGVGERQRPDAGVRRAGLGGDAAAEPRVVVGLAPDGDRVDEAVELAEGVEVVAPGVAELGVHGRGDVLVGRVERAVVADLDVHLGHLLRQAGEGRGQRADHVGHRGGRGVAQRDVHLVADAVDGHTARLQAGDELVDAGELGGVGRAVVVVVELDVGRQQRAGGAEGGVDEVGARQQVPVALAHAVGLRRVNDLVGDVPGVEAGDVGCEVVEHVGDVVHLALQHQGLAGRRGRQRGTVGVLEDPGRHLFMPGQRVAAQLQALGLGEGDLGVGGGVGEHALLGLQRAPLHVVLGHQAVEVLGDEVGLHAADAAVVGDGADGEIGQLALCHRRQARLDAGRRHVGHLHVVDEEGVGVGGLEVQRQLAVGERDGVGAGQADPGRRADGRAVDDGVVRRDRAGVALQADLDLRRGAAGAGMQLGPGGHLVGRAVEHHVRDVIRRAGPGALARGGQQRLAAAVSAFGRVREGRAAAEPALRAALEGGRQAGRVRRQARCAGDQRDRHVVDVERRRRAAGLQSIRHPLTWVPSLYLAMGLPNVMVGVVAAIIYKNLGVSNEDIALYTSQMYLPWVLKPLWAPLLEAYRSKRFWVISMEFTMAAGLGLVALCLPLDGFFKLSLAFFWLVGFASATQDTCADGVFMTTVSKRDQARYAGLQGMCWNMGAVVASGLFVSLTGYLHNHMGMSWVECWVIVVSLAAAAMAAFGLWHVRVLPPGAPSTLQGQGLSGGYTATREAWVTFFKKPQIWMMLAVIFFYRFGEGFIEKFGPLFLLDATANGGLGMDNEALGHINGTVGTLTFIAGAFLGGFLVAKRTLPRSFFTLALVLNIPHLTYFYLAQSMPTDTLTIAVIVSIEKFGFGMGSVGHMLYMMQQIAPGPFRMAHYAMATGVMALTKWSTGSVSALLWNGVEHNYVSFFGWVLVFSVPPAVEAHVLHQVGQRRDRRPAARMAFGRQRAPAVVRGAAHGQDDLDVAGVQHVDGGLDVRRSAVEVDAGARPVVGRHAAPREVGLRERSDDVGVVGRDARQVAGLEDLVHRLAGGIEPVVAPARVVDG
ncbi:transporter, major facilitator family protein, partial [Ostertagia ostertagi]